MQRVSDHLPITDFESEVAHYHSEQSYVKKVEICETLQKKKLEHVADHLWRKIFGGKNDRVFIICMFFVNKFTHWILEIWVKIYKGST